MKKPINLDIICKAYILYTKENDRDIAQYFYQEFDTKKKNSAKIFSQNQYFNKLINELNLIIGRTIHRSTQYDPKVSSFGYTEESLLHMEDYLHTCQVFKENARNNYAEYTTYLFERNLPIPDWENCNDAEKLKTAIYKFLITVKNPVTFLDPSPEISKETMVVRKSNLEFLKKEAERAKKAKTIDELDEIDEPVQQLISSYGTKDKVIKKHISEAKDILKPFEGFYKMDKVLNNDDIQRLFAYVESIISNGKLPATSKFPKITLPNEFIRKTIHNVYVSIGKKYKNEFIKLIHLFENFNETSIETSQSKFSSYQGNYKKKLEEIKY